jgi:selenocysteine lyase/cysteine desulfurase
VEWVSPADEKLSAGVLICRIPGKDGRELFGSLYQDHGIACAPTGGLRFSPHIYNTLEEVEKVGEALAVVSRS